MTDNLSRLEAAQWFVKMGCAVMPAYGTKTLGDGRVVCACPDGVMCEKGPGKHAVEVGWQNKEYRSEADLYSWWHPDHNGGVDYNLAVRTGRVSGIVVVDVDPLHGGMQTLDMLLAEGIVSPTFLYRTGSTGLHLWSRVDDLAVPNGANRLGPGADIRGENGYVIVPPSRSPRGLYEFVPDAPPIMEPTPGLRALFEQWADQKARNVETEVVEGDPSFDIASMPRRLLSIIEEVPDKKADPSVDRSKIFHNFVGQAMRDGYTQAQVVTAVAPWCEASGKYVGRVASAVSTSWGNLMTERSRLEIHIPELVEAYAQGRRVYEQAQAQPQIHPPGTEDWLRVEEGDEFASVLWKELWKADLAPKWLVENLFEAGRSYSVHGGPGAGKSLIMLDFAAQLASGRLTGEIVPVAYFDRENTPSDLISRLLDLGYEPDELDGLRYFLFPDVSLNVKDEAQRFIRQVVTSGARMVVIDTVARFVRGVKENESEWVTDFFNYAIVPLKERGITIVRLDHTGHSGGNARGTSAKLGDVDGAWSIALDKPTQIMDWKLEKSRTGNSPEWIQFQRTRHPTTHKIRWISKDAGDEPPTEVPPTLLVNGVEEPVLPPLDQALMPMVEALDRLFGSSPCGRDRAEKWLRLKENGGFTGRSAKFKAACSYRNARLEWERNRERSGNGGNGRSGTVWERSGTVDNG